MDKTSSNFPLRFQGKFASKVNRCTGNANAPESKDAPPSKMRLILKTTGKNSKVAYVQTKEPFYRSLPITRQSGCGNRASSAVPPRNRSRAAERLAIPTALVAHRPIGRASCRERVQWVG